MYLFVLTFLTISLGTLFIICVYLFIFCVHLFVLTFLTLSLDTLNIIYNSIHACVRICFQEDI